MRALLVLALFAVACQEVEDNEPDACKQLRLCFYATEEDAEKLGEVREGLYENFAAGRSEMIAAYGPGGTCYVDEESTTACENRCLCALRELCNDEEARKLTCATTEGPDNKRCCGLQALHDLEARLFDAGPVPPPVYTEDDLDPICEVPMTERLGDRDGLCVFE